MVREDTLFLRWLQQRAYLCFLLWLEYKREMPSPLLQMQELW
jgi:hypothetical protein